MWRLGRLLPRTILLVLSILAGICAVSVASLPGSVLARGQGIHRDAMPSVISLTATPLRAAPLEMVTFAAALRNGGYTYGPYRATLQLLPENGGRHHSLTQSGFMLRHNQPLTLYWEWRAGASLPCGIYAMRVQLGTMAKPRRVVASFTAGLRLTIVPR
jgi:hypothetical protein